MLTITLTAVLSAFSSPIPDGLTVESSFSSLLGFAPTRGAVTGRIVHNSDEFVADNRGIHSIAVRGRAGQNLVDASLLVDAEGPGLWRFNFSAVPRFRPGSLRVLVGDVVVLNARTLVVQSNGRAGPVARFAYDLVP